MRRWFDGLVRQVISFRYISNDNGKRTRVEMLSCGHEQAFEAKKKSDANPYQRSICTLSPHQNRVCRQCEPDRYGHTT